MEKKTIGAFLCALRKAHGLTQKQLAEKLNVSDKAVSRWERDETMPDLSLIPVLAEIFGVTSDEILRGERQNPDMSTLRSDEKTEKQRKRILSDKRTKYQIRSTVSIGIAVLGLIAAMICNFGFLRAYIGFMVGCVFYAAAAVCQVIFIFLDLSGLDPDMLTDDELAQCRDHTFKLAAITFQTILTLAAASVPLVVIPWDTYQGLEGGYWALYGSLYAAICLVVLWILTALVKLRLAKKGALAVAPGKLALYRLRLRCFGLFALTVAALLLVQSILNSVLPDLLREGVQLHSWDSFKSLMETPVEDASIYEDGIGQFGVHISTNTEPIDVPIESVPSDSENIIYHEDGSIIVFEDDPTEQIRDENGKLLCEFVLRNHSVSGWEYDNDGGELTITVYTAESYANANLIMDDLVNPIFILLYPIAAVVYFLLYRRKAKTL